MSATIREVDLRDAYPPEGVLAVWSRRKDGKPKRIKNPAVLGKAARLVVARK